MPAQGRTNLDEDRPSGAPTALRDRLVVAGTHSGVGKTTVATGLMAALRRAGHAVAGAKAGPDFIDPGYHALASGHPPRNLDPWLCGLDALPGLAARAAAGTDILIIEGVMGLFDGASDGTASATADVAKALHAPVVLVVDAQAMSNSVAALVSGFAHYDPDLDVAGVILNHVGSEGHDILLREALAPLRIPVLGALRSDDRFAWRNRHLGLVPVAEHTAEVASNLDRLAAAVTEHTDLDAVTRLAAQAPRTTAGPVRLPTPGQAHTSATTGLDSIRSTRLSTSPVVAVAGGPAFTFTYTDTLEALRATGLEPVTFDPLRDEALPEGAVGLLAGGGFPETHVDELAANRTLLADVARHAAQGRPVWGECGGLLWLGQSLDDQPMAGVTPTVGQMTERLTLGYRDAVTLRPSPLGPAGTTFKGHEFHFTAVEAATAGHPGGEALHLSSRWGERADGWATPSLLATYLHFHPGGDPTPVENFSRACLAWLERPVSPQA